LTCAQHGRHHHSGESQSREIKGGAVDSTTQTVHDCTHLYTPVHACTRLYTARSGAPDCVHVRLWPWHDVPTHPLPRQVLQPGLLLDYLLASLARGFIYTYWANNSLASRPLDVCIVHHHIVVQWGYGVVVPLGSTTPHGLSEGGGGQHRVYIAIPYGKFV
jgi:hypothetical protein